MPSFETVSDAISFDDGMTMEVLGYVPIYGSVEGADRYFSERLDGQLWEVASADNKKKSLITATRAIDRLRFGGSKTDETQPLEWPRNSEDTLPECLVAATYEEAFALIKGIEPDTEYANLNVVSRVFGKVRTDYAGRVAPEHVVAGIASFKAWRLLQPLLNPALGVTLRRWS